METMTFKTNAKCMGCLAKIEEILQGKMNREEWNLDLSDSNRPLTVTGRNKGSQLQQTFLLRCLNKFTLLYFLKKFRFRKYSQRNKVYSKRM